MQCVRSRPTAERTLEGVEALHMVGEGQVERVDGRDSVGQAKFVASLPVPPRRRGTTHDSYRLKPIFATQPVRRCPINFSLSGLYEADF